MKRIFFSVEKLPRILWGLAMLTLPVTSFRWFPFLGDGTLVRPLALYPLALLLPLLFVQAWRKKIQFILDRCVRCAWSISIIRVFATSFGAVIDPIPFADRPTSDAPSAHW
jgi:hypothetical protein